jgi:GntR family transcriptional regulator/MocR family aminotransferase
VWITSSLKYDVATDRRYKKVDRRRPLTWQFRERPRNWYHRLGEVTMNPDSHKVRSPAGLLIRIDGRATEGLQQQVYGAVRRAILDGTLAPGIRLPSSRALAEDLRVSRTTTLLAFEQLLAEGYLVARHGSGTFVAHELPDDLPRQVPRVRAARTKHPQLSRRGVTLVNTPGAARRIGGPPRAFRLGVPALDLFPLRLWSQLVNRRLRSATISQLDYSDSAGFAALRVAIAEHVETARGTRCSADQVLVVAGAQRGLQLIDTVLLDQGDRVWLEEPGYPGARSAFISAGARIVPVPVDRDGLDVAAARRLAPDARMAYVTPSNQFPLGVPMSVVRRLALLRWASSAGAWVVEDDYDSEFRYGTRPFPCLHGLDSDGRVIYVGTFAKSIFPALRLGFVIVPSDLRELFMAARRGADIHPPLLEQMALADFVGEGHYARHLRRMRLAHRERLEALTDAATRLCRGVLTLRPVQTGLHAVADLDGVDEQRVCEEASDRGVEVTPLGMFFLDRPTATGLLLGFASTRPDTIRRGMERLAASLEAARRPSARRQVLPGATGRSSPPVNGVARAGSRG